MHFIQQQQKYSVFTGVAILIIYVSKKDWAYCLIFRNYLCLLHSTDNCDLQSCEVGQGKDVAITTPAQSTLCILGHQEVPRLASDLDSILHTSTRGFWSKKNSLIWVQIARYYFQCSTWNVLSWVTTSWGLNTLLLKTISKLFDRTTTQWNRRFLCQNCQLAPPTWAIMRDLAWCTRG